MNFEILIVELYVFIISFIFAKFQENRKLIAMSIIKCLNFKFLWYKTMLWGGMRIQKYGQIGRG